MTRDDIIRMAHKAGFNMVHYSNKEPLLCEAWGDEIHLERFAALVAAAEREVLKEEIEKFKTDANRYKWLRDNLVVSDLDRNEVLRSYSNLGYALTWQDALDLQVDEAIRARGEKP